MKFTSKGTDGINIEFQGDDSLEEIRVVEQGVATLKNLLKLIRSVNKGELK